jgi:pantetheine-phosphate adenylyltransferase
MKTTAIYPGTFDPVTYGHLDVLDRASLLFNKVIISVAASSAKNTLFSVEERMELLRKVVKGRNIEVDSFNNLLIQYAKDKKANVIIRGLRAVSDFEYEFQMALTNRKIEDEVTTVFLMPNEKYTYLNSTLVREIAKFHGDVSAFVPPVIRKALEKKFRLSA